MYLLTYHGQVQGFSADSSKISNFLTDMFSGIQSTWQQSSRSDYWKRNYPTVESYLSREFLSIRIYDVPDSFYMKRGSSIAALLGTAGVAEVTSEWFSFEEEEITVGYDIKATVTKKGLKSSGKVVTVNHEVGGSQILETSQVKELLDKLTRVNVSVPGWGKMSLAPDSLSDYERVPRINKIAVLKFKEEEVL